MRSQSTAGRFSRTSPLFADGLDRCSAAPFHPLLSRRPM